MQPTMSQSSHTNFSVTAPQPLLTW